MLTLRDRSLLAAAYETDGQTARHRHGSDAIRGLAKRRPVGLTRLSRLLPGAGEIA